MPEVSFKGYECFVYPMEQLNFQLFFIHTNPYMHRTDRLRIADKSRADYTDPYAALKSLGSNRMEISVKPQLCTVAGYKYEQYHSKRVSIENLGTYGMGAAI